jgi:hypothetical protein
MTELNDIFEYDLPRAVFIWGSITMMIASIIAAIWLIKSKCDAKSVSANDSGFRANPSSTKPTRRP